MSDTLVEVTLPEPPDRNRVSREHKYDNKVKISYIY